MKTILFFLLLASTAWASPAPDHEYPLYDPPAAYDQEHPWIYFDLDGIISDGVVPVLTIDGKQYFLFRFKDRVYFYDKGSGKSFRFGVDPQRWKKR